MSDSFSRQQDEKTGLAGLDCSFCNIDCRYRSREFKSGTLQWIMYSRWMMKFFSEREQRYIFKFIFDTFIPERKENLVSLGCQSLLDLLRILQGHASRTEDTPSLFDTEKAVFREIMQITMDCFKSFALIYQMGRNESWGEPPPVSEPESPKKVFPPEDFLQQAFTFDDFLQSLGVRARNVLIKSRISSFPKLVSLSDIQLKRLKNCGRKTVDEIITQLNFFLKTYPIVLPEVCNSPPPNAGATSLPSPDFLKAIKSLDTRSANTLLKKLKIRSFEDLKGLDIDSLDSIAFVGMKTKARIFHLIEELENIIAVVPPPHESQCQTEKAPKTFSLALPFESLKELSKMVCGNPKFEEVFWNRFGFRFQGVETFLNLGAKMGMTRQRIQHMECSIKRKLSRHSVKYYLSPLLDTVKKGFANSFKSWEDLFLHSFKGNDEALLLFQNSRPFFEFFFPKEKGLSAKQSKQRQFYLPKSFWEKIVEIGKSCAIESPSAFLWKSNLIDIWNGFEPYFETVKAEFPYINFDFDIFHKILECNSSFVKIREDFVFSKEYYAITFGNLDYAAEAILKISTVPLHYSEIARQLESVSQRKISKDWSIRMALGRCNRALLWKRGGIFLHSSKINPTQEFLSEVESRIKAHLKRSPFPCLSAQKVFRDCKESAIANGIIGECSFYFSLKYFLSDSFYFPKYPFIYLKEGFSEYLSFPDLIEGFFIQFTEPISKQDIREAFGKQLGVTMGQFDIHKNLIPSILRASKTHWVHAQNLTVNWEEFEKVFQYVLKQTKEHGHVSVRKILEEKKIQCRLCGIDNPYLLFHLIKYYSFSKFDESPVSASEFPQVKSISETDSKPGLLNSVYTYILEKKKPCSYDDLLKTFKKLGYKEDHIMKVRLVRKEIIKYTSTSLIHVSNLGLDSLKESIFESVVTETLKKENDLGRNYCSIEKVFECQESLPVLANELLWTPTLISEVIGLNEDFLTLGTTKNIFLSRANPWKMKSQNDLVLNILQDKFNGASPFEDLEHFLISERIILRRLNPSTISKDDRFVLIKNEVFSKEYYQKTFGQENLNA